MLHLHLPECSLSANSTNSHYPLILSGENTCVIFNCANSSIKIKLWKQKECRTHKASTARRMPLFSAIQWMNEYKLQYCNICCSYEIGHDKCSPHRSYYWLTMRDHLDTQHIRTFFKKDFLPICSWAKDQFSKRSLAKVTLAINYILAHINLTLILSSFLDFNPFPQAPWQATFSSNWRPLSNFIHLTILGAACNDNYETSWVQTHR